MTLAQSAQIYTILSIGDGLVSQIPSLLISLTAGIVTTRVSSDRRDANLGREISSQILREPRAVLIAAGVTFGLGFFKGFPLWTFTILALLLGLSGIAVLRKKKKRRLVLRQVFPVRLKRMSKDMRWSPVVPKITH